VKASYARQAQRWQQGQYRSWTRGNMYIEQGIERAMFDKLRRHGHLPVERLEILDIGCGGGRRMLRFLAAGARRERLHGIDIQADLVETARQAAPDLDLRVGDARDLPFPAAGFDLVLAFTMLSSMGGETERMHAAAEMRRVLRPGGAVLVYDFWTNPLNPDVQPVGVRQLRRLFPDCTVDASLITLAAPVARAVAPYSWLACALLEAVPLLRTHRLALIAPVHS
jgi:ubiquinone/menaquinone biosynthesis C-methylase UbiE